MTTLRAFRVALWMAGVGSFSCFHSSSVFGQASAGDVTGAPPAPTVSVTPPIVPAPSPANSAQTQVEAYTLPDAPALTLINVNGSKIQEPGSVQQLGAALLSGFTPQGGLQTGLAIEVTGRAFGVGYDYSDYSESYMTRLLARLSLSLGTVKDSTTPTTTLGAIGLRIVFLDGTDPLIDPGYRQYVRDVAANCPPPLQTGDATKDAAALAAHQKCYSKIPPFPAPPWNADGLALAGATSDAFANGALGQGKWPTRRPGSRARNELM
jgi:hypothetical protein